MHVVMATFATKVTLLIFVQYVSSVQPDTFSVTSPIVDGRDLELECTVQRTTTWSVEVVKQKRTILHVTSNCTDRSLSLAAAYEYKCEWTPETAVVRLVVKHASRVADHGTWVCETERTRLEVTLLPSDYKVVTKSVILLGPSILYEHETYIIMCQTSASNPASKLTWRYRIGREEHELRVPGTVTNIVNKDGLYHMTSRLPYTAKRGDKHGMIYCIANNGFKDVSSSNLTLDVRYPATVRIASNTTVYTILAGSDLVFHCEFVDGNPGPSSVTWFKDDALIGRNFTYRKSNIIAGDSGNYTCDVITDVKFPRATASKQVHVLYAPTIHLPRWWAVEELSTLNISCSVTENPYATSIVYSWRGPRGFTSSKRHLTIEAIQRWQSGNYTCRVEEYVHSNDVTYLQTLKSDGVVYIDVQYPPFLELPNSTLEVTEHSVLRVTCLVYAHPPPHSVAWITPGGAIIPSDRLVVPDILRLQGGVYTCQAANTLVTNRGELQHRTASKPVWIFVLPAEDHSKTGMSPAAYITVGVVVGAAVVLIIVAAVVVYNRRRKAINQDGSRGQRKSSVAGKVIGFQNTASCDNVSYTSGIRHNSYADIIYLDGGYINPAHDMATDYRQQNLYVNVADGGYSQPDHDVIFSRETCPLHHESDVDREYYHSNNDVTSSSNQSIQKQDGTLDTCDGGYLHPALVATSSTEYHNIDEQNSDEFETPKTGWTTRDGEKLQLSRSVDNNDLTLNQQDGYEDLDLGHNVVKTEKYYENVYSESTT